jgi:hypothetical protein
MSGKIVKRAIPGVSAWAYPFVVDEETEVLEPDTRKDIPPRESGSLVAGFVWGGVLCTLSAALPAPLAVLGFAWGLVTIVRTMKRYNALLR